MSGFWVEHSLAVYILFVGALLSVVVGLSAILGPRRVGAARGRSMSIPFESGILPTASAKLRFPIQYYRVAMFFVIFDVESVLLFAWAPVARDVGWAAYGTVVLFIAFLGVALAYLWRGGALEWGPQARHLSEKQPNKGA